MRKNIKINIYNDQFTCSNVMGPIKIVLNKKEK